MQRNVFCYPSQFWHISDNGDSKCVKLMSYGVIDIEIILVGRGRDLKTAKCDRALWISYFTYTSYRMQLLIRAGIKVNTC